jgi:hypothetical protein
MRRLPLLVALVLLGPVVALGATFDEFAAKVTDAVAASFGRAQPLIAASAGVNYRFDPATASFEREDAIVGQLFLERADPIGKRRWNLGLSYQHLVLDSLGGQPADDLRDPTPIPNDVPGIPAFRFDRLALKGGTHEFTASLTYGVTENLDVNLTGSLVYSDLDVEADASRAVILGGLPFRQSFSFAEPTRVVGSGDVLLRAKYRVFQGDLFHAAGGLVIRLPAGDAQNLQGAGIYEVSPLLYASTRTFRAASWAQLQGYLNGGLALNASDVAESAARWGVGLDWGITPGWTMALAFLARHEFARLAPPGFFDTPRCGPGFAGCILGQSQPASPLFGIDGRRPDYYDLSVGTRVNLWRDTVIGFVNALFPLNNEGVRTEIVPLVGVEATF